MKTLTISNKILYSLLYFVLFIYLVFIFIERQVNKKWLSFSFDKPQKKEISGKIIWYWSNNEDDFYILLTKTDGRIFLKTDKYKNLSLTDEIRVIIDQKNLNIYNNYENYIYNNFFVDKIGYILEVLEVKENNNFLSKFLKFLFKTTNITRNFLIKMIDENINSSISKDIISKISIGYDYKDEDEIKNYFQKIGVAHVLVVSGLHVGFVYLFIYFLTKFLPLSVELRIGVSLLGVVFYMLITGCEIPVVRATIMIFCFGISFLLYRKTNLYHILSLAALILLFINPRSIFTVSFQLSFLACFGIFYFYRFFLNFFEDFIKQQNSLFQSIIKLFFITVSAQLMVSPLIAYYFNRFSIISFISNIIIVPLTSVIVWISLISFVLSFLFKNFSFILWQFLEIFVSFYFKIVKLFSEFPLSEISLSVSSIEIFVYYCLILSVPYFIKYKMKKIASLFIVSVLFTFFLYYYFNKKFIVTFFDVGLGDSVFILTENKKAFLIDTPSNNMITKTKIIPYLKDKRVKKINYLIITHPHYIHYGSLEYILDNFSLENIIVSDFVSEDYEYERILDKIKNKNIKLEFVNYKKIIEFKNGKVEIVKNNKIKNNNLDKESLADINSLLIKIFYKDKTIILTNDLEASEIIKNISCYNKLDVFQIPKHGKYLGDINCLLEYFKEQKIKIVLGIVSTDGVNFDVRRFKFPILSTNKFKNIEIIFSSKRKQINNFGYITKVRI